ncbi:uncharacterized protein [Diabrotica undecimpunctata]|uniref:uncharacterized protein n=1 Tax=Diabrotica undecimpunctata TaxID=50387 RepID=UPI003B635798
MGQYFSSVISGILDYPLKPTRYCAFIPEVPQDEKVDSETEEEETESKYDKLVKDFNKKLLENRTEKRQRIDGKSWEEKNLAINFPDWNESTISYLHSLFLTFLNESNKMIDFEAFSCILLCLWSDCDLEKRRKRFTVIDTNQDGFIDYLDFLELIYFYDNLADAARKIAEQTQFINKLSIGEQLEHGLF